MSSREILETVHRAIHAAQIIPFNEEIHRESGSGAGEFFLFFF